MDRPEVIEVNQVWSDNDIRAAVQEFTVIEVTDTHAIVRRGDRKSRIRLERLLNDASSRGYTYVGKSK